MKKFKGLILPLAMAVVLLNSALLWGNINLNGLENPNNGSSFTIQQDPNAAPS